MSLLGKAALIAWHDVEDSRRTEYLHWHSHEHMQERIALPGFLRGRRYSAVKARSHYLVIYDVAELSDFTSSAYLERLNHPSVWTKETMPSLRNMNRSLCLVQSSIGSGVGGFLQTMRFAPRSGAADRVTERLRGELTEISAHGLLCGAHHLVADATISKTPTNEAALRGRDTVADWVLLIEGYDIEAVAINPARLVADEDVDGDLIADTYRLDHLVDAQSRQNNASGMRLS